MSEKKLPCPVKGGADFTPNLGHYSGIRPFRAWVQMVLPQVYNDALSYQELVYRLLWYINTLLEDVNTCEEDIGKLKEAFEQLQCYVNMYFYKLDLSSVIDDKLDAMAESGYLTTLLVKYIEAGSGIEIEVTTETKTKEVPIPCYCKVCPLDKSCCPSCKWYDKETGEFSTTETVEYDVTKVNIHTNLVEGDGISISPESSSTYGAQTISTNLVEGDGIDITTNENGSQTIGVKVDTGTGLDTEVGEDGTITVTTDVGNVTGGVGISVATTSGNTKKVYTNLKSGDGISISPASSSSNSGAQTLSTNIEAGDGVVIDTDDNGKQTISVNIKNGGGVVVDTDDDGSITIATTSAGNYKNTLVRGTDFVVSIPGIIYPVYGSAESTYRDYEHYTEIVEDDIYYPELTANVGKDTEGNVTSMTLRISTRSYLAAGNIADSSLFALRHASDVQEVPCGLLDFYFIGDYAELSNPDNDFVVTNPTSAIWNVRAIDSGDTELTANNVGSLTTFGASWAVNVTLQTYDDDDGIKHYVLAAHSISDGYNGQYSHWGKYVYGTWLSVNPTYIEMTVK